MAPKPVVSAWMALRFTSEGHPHLLVALSSVPKTCLHKCPLLKDHADHRPGAVVSCFPHRTINHVLVPAAAGTPRKRAETSWSVIHPRIIVDPMWTLTVFTEQTVADGNQCPAARTSPAPRGAAGRAGPSEAPLTPRLPTVHRCPPSTASRSGGPGTSRRKRPQSWIEEASHARKRARKLGTEFRSGRRCQHSHPLRVRCGSCHSTSRVCWGPRGKEQES